MFNRLLVATDFSAPSEAALKHARIIARAFGGSIHVLHVLPNVFLRAVVNDPHALESSALAQLREWLTEDGRLQAGASVARSDEPADEIVSYARAHGFDLIVMGTHGRSGVAHFLMGSVAEHVVRNAPCPVLTVHTPPAGRDLARVLVPTDFSASADAALDAARAITARFGGSIHLLHIMSEPADTGAEMYVPESPDARAERLKDAMDRLGHRVTAPDRTQGLAQTEVVSGVPADTIIGRAGEFDLVVMGTHGRKGMAHVLMGSVAERVVRHARCPVITVRQPTTDALAGGRTAAEATSPEARTSRSGTAPGRG